MQPRNRLPRHTGRTCANHSARWCDGRCQAPDQVVADVLTGMIATTFADELPEWSADVDAAMLPLADA